MEGDRISAVILDLDGTLLDTERTSAGVLNEFLAKYGKAMDAEKDEKRVGLMPKEAAMAVVEDYDLPLTAEEFSAVILPLYHQRWPQAKALPGANRLINHLCKHGVPLALASNSRKKHIEMKILHHQGWKESFRVILGGDEVNNGKPSPDIFLEAAKRLGVDTANCLVIEDSLVGVRAAKASGAKVVAVPSLQSQAGYFSIANCVLHSLLEFQPELWSLPAFQDWHRNALPIESLYARDLICNNAPRDGRAILSIITDNGSCVTIPDQVSGVLIGWAKHEKHGISKVLVSIGWDISSRTAKRVIQLQFLDQINTYISKEQFHLLLVGYIRKLHDEKNILEALELSEEDETIARAALDLPVFHYNMDNSFF